MNSFDYLSYIYYLICLIIYDVRGNDGLGIGIIMKINNNLKIKDKLFFFCLFLYFVIKIFLIISIMKKFNN